MKMVQYITKPVQLLYNPRLTFLATCLGYGLADQLVRVVTLGATSPMHKRVKWLWVGL